MLMLFIMAFFQLILAIENNFKENVYQIGVLRSIGMTNFEVQTIIFIESTANVQAAILIGALVGYIIKCVAMSELSTFTETRMSYQFDLKLFTLLLLVGFLTTLVGTKLTMQLTRRKSVS